MTSSTPGDLSAAARHLRSSLRGGVLVPADEQYDGARRVWNGAVDRRPGLIVRAADEQDVQTAVRVAHDHGLRLSVRGGGHDWGGRAMAEGGLVVDMSALRRVNVDPILGTADVQGGATSGDLADAAGRHGLAPVTGTVQAVGIAGLTLGGGYGLLLGKHGLAADNLISARVVLPDGRRVIASGSENPDLFWALRGGGGNFGVVTNLRYRVHALQSLAAGLILFPASEAASVLRGYRELIAEAPDELTVMSGFFGGPDGTPMLFMLPTWVGALGGGQRHVTRLESLGTPIMSQVRQMTFPELHGMFADSIVDGRHVEMRTRWVPEVSDDIASVIAEGMAQMTSPFSAMFLHHFHGAATRVPVAESAFATRREHVLVEIAAQWLPTEDAAPHQRWARSLSEKLAPHALPGGYPNFLGPDEQDRVLLGYGPNADRLVELKRRFDPAGVFTAVPQIDVAAHEAAGRKANQMTATVETIRFKLRPGVTDAEFQQRNLKMQREYMELRPGFVSRETSRSDEGEYLVVVHWSNAEDADATIQAFFGAPETQDFLASVDVTTVASGRYEVVKY
ncbi:FAD-binding oxidoreductase [Saccharothrix sp. 6-C]|uniref:FAD/FMN-containing dehydrogenase n=1 Tax=Saccharothrix texasensis TaxID=103734 RepID=A0A3N1GYT1_9PSEU|nr:MULTISPECIES: FAD-binding oxidoreductase [Saccharothrix]QQQ79645.1 FAD-binding oxidoreductase [Saccharothrix sp. 6-C]ROP35192.1 FAD/FMN-containing dehydrogenase [Saccharothrix texasensis]